MANRADGLIINSLGDNVSSTHAPAAGTTAQATIAPSSGMARVCLTNIGWSIRNATAAAYTATLNVRDVSAGGNTVVASWDVVVAVGGSAQDSFNYTYKGIRGDSVQVDFGTPAASVVQKVNVAGWREDNTWN